MKPRLHKCRATGCQCVISARLLMCVDHWRMVPAAGRRDVIGTLRALRRDRTEATLQAYIDAVSRAVAAVEEKQERKAQAAAGSSGSLFT